MTEQDFAAWSARYLMTYEEGGHHLLCENAARHGPQ